MAIRLSGINSGLDTDAIVQELVSAYSLKTQKYEKAQTKLSWKQETWKNLNTKIYGLYTNVSNLRLSSAYNLRKTSVSDGTKATVTASSTAPTGTQQLKINKTAQAGYITGGELKKGVTKDTKLSELGFNVDGETEIEVRRNNGETETITVKKGTTVSEFVNSLKEAGLNASFDENNRRIFVNAKESGKENDFTLVGVGQNGEDALKALKLDVPMMKLVDGEYEFTNAASAYKDAYDLYKKLSNGGTLTDTTENGTIIKKEEHLKNLLEEKFEEYKDLQKAYNDADYDYSAALSAESTALNRKDYLEKVQNAVEIATPKLEEWNEKLNTKLRELNVGEVDITIEDLVYNCTVNDLTEGNIVGKDKLKLLLSEETGLSGDELSSTIDELLTDDFQNAFSSIHNYLTTPNDTSEVKIDADGNEVTDGSGNKVVLDATIENLSEKLKVIEKRIETAQANMATAQSTMTGRQEAMEATGVADLVKIRDEEIARLKEIAKAEAQEKNEEFKEEEWLQELETANPSKQVEFNNAIKNLISNAFRAEEMKEEMAKAPENRTEDFTTANASKIDADDAEIELNGVTFTSSDNSFSVNGLSINALATTTETISITTSVDTQGIYDKVKDFLTEYNTLINEMTKLYNADSAKDYEPLTDEEKEAMSEEQIEKWENKIKDSLLRRDTTLNSVMSAMINTMAQSYEINGEKVSLSTFGIATLGFLNAPDNENYAYHIAGDEDDENTSSKEDKLMKAIQEDPDKIMEFMKKLTSSLYSAIDNKMKSTNLSSAYKVYNDKEIDKQYKEYSSIISQWEKKVSEREDYYYKKFSQMEVALSKLNDQTSALSGMLGM